MTTEETSEDSLSLVIQFFVLASYGVLTILGHIRDFIDNILGIGKQKTPEGYAPLTNDFEEFYRRRLYSRIIDLFNRPITGAAAGTIKVLKNDFKNLHVVDYVGNNNTAMGDFQNINNKINRNDIFNNNNNNNNDIFNHINDNDNNNDNDIELTKLPQFNKNDYIDCLNLSSYNYLGFGQPGHKICEPNVLDTIDKYGISTCTETIYTSTILQKNLEKKVSSFLNVEDSMIFGMGWGVNSTAIPALVGKGCLIISDSKNHNSIVVGARTSGATIRTFKHNDPIALEKKIRQYIIDGQPKNHRPWKKILIIVEGVYSMEGEVCKLKEIVEIKKKYKCYLYLDEAHSIGACGKTGRGVCELTGVNTKDIDILMGTFTKSFGAIGGYIAGKKSIISIIKQICASNIISCGLSPACQMQILTVLNIIDTNEGKNKIKQLHMISDYVRKTLTDMGFSILGHYGTAIVPLLIGLPAKFPAVSRYLLNKGYAVVIVGYPAVPIYTGRIRLCLSSNHTMQQAKQFCNVMSKLGDSLRLKYVKRTIG